MSFLITIEGIDGSGKGTQAKLLLENLLQANITARLLSFPRYQDTFYGQRAADFLNGKFGSLDQVHPFLAALLFAGDRWESRDLLTTALAEVDVVICDRYVPSNLAHQCSKVTPEFQPELIRWLKHVEYTMHQLPQPDLVIWLKLPVQQAQQLVLKKGERQYTQQVQDIQEADAGYLAKVAAVYAQLAESEHAWYTLDMMTSNTLPGIRTVDSLADEILQLVKQGLLAKSGQHDHPLTSVQAGLTQTLALTSPVTTTQQETGTTQQLSWEELISSRQQWPENVLKPWCRTATVKQLFLAELEWNNLAGQVDPQFTLWRWAWGRFTGLVHEQLGINETHKIEMNLNSGETKSGYPDARRSMRHEIVLYDGKNYQPPVSLSEISSIKIVD